MLQFHLHVFQLFLPLSLLSSLLSSPWSWSSLPLPSISSLRFSLSIWGCRRVWLRPFKFLLTQIQPSISLFYIMHVSFGLQDICMPAMRAQASAIYVGVITIIASLGPVLVRLYVFCSHAPVLGETILLVNHCRTSPVPRNDNIITLLLYIHTVTTMVIHYSCRFQHCWITSHCLIDVERELAMHSLWSYRLSISYQLFYLQC